MNCKQCTEGNHHLCDGIHDDGGYFVGRCDCHTKFHNKTTAPSIPSWDEWFLRQVYLVSTRSKDPSSKIGAIIVNDSNQIVKIGYNGFPSKVDDLIGERWNKPKKLLMVCHAEANCIFFAAKDGVKTNNCSMYTNGISCCECAKSIIQSGIRKLYYHKQFQDKWNEFMTSDWESHEDITRIMFYESGVELIPLDINLNIKTIIRGNSITL